jgi:hypothetical protein
VRRLTDIVPSPVMPELNHHTLVATTGTQTSLTHWVLVTGLFLTYRGYRNYRQSLEVIVREKLIHQQRQQVAQCREGKLRRPFPVPPQPRLVDRRNAVIQNAINQDSISKPWEANATHLMSPHSPSFSVVSAVFKEELEMLGEKAFRNDDSDASRKIAVWVSYHALKTATLLSTGVFTIVTACIMAASGIHSVESGRSMLRPVSDAAAAMNDMTEDEEIQHLLAALFASSSGSDEMPKELANDQPNRSTQS